MNSLLGKVRSNQLCKKVFTTTLIRGVTTQQLEVISCAKKCLLLPYFEEYLHKAIKICGQVD